MLRVSDCAGLVDDSRVAPFPVLPSASSNDVGALNGLISQLNTGPTCAPAELLHHTGSACRTPLPGLCLKKAPLTRPTTARWGRSFGALGGAI